MNVSAIPELTPKEMRRAIYALAMPIVGTNLLLRGVGVVDTALIGHVAASSQAAVGMAQWIISLMMSLMQGVALGGTIAVANFTGARDEKNRLASGDTVLWLGVGSSILITITGLLFTRSIAVAMGATTQLLPMVQSYMLIMNIFFLSKGMIQVVSGIFQGYGDTKTPFRVIVGVNIIHLIIAYPLTFGAFGFPRLTIVGVALATGFSETMGAAVLIYLAYRKNLIRFRFFSKERLKSIVTLGTPVFGERVLTTIMQMVYTRMVLFTSLSAYAAHSIGITIEMMSFLPGIAFSQAATTLVGQQLGAKSPGRARRFGNQAIIVGFTIMGIIGLTFWFFPRLWMMLFSNDSEVIRYGIIYCKVVAFLQVPEGLAMVLSGSLRGAGQTRWVMYSTIIGGWFFRIPFAYVVSSVLHLSIVWVWLAMPLDWIVRSAVLFIKYSDSRWHENTALQIKQAKSDIH
jgi:putative MATE family efflux protein